MYEGVAKLKKYGPTTYDKYGNPITPIEERKVFVQPRGVYASEFYSAAQIGLKPSITFDIANRADYRGEKVIEFKGEEYTVIREDWSAPYDGISLVCEAGNKYLVTEAEESE